MSQDDIVEYFKTCVEGALKFTQSTLSRKLKSREKLEARANYNPTALSSKCPHIVTCPDVEKALYLWVKQMEAKGEVVNGPMLVAKHGRFEMAFDIPKNERLSGDGWVASFCRAYQIKEHQRHGEAGSVDLVAVEAEQVCICAILSKYQPKDRFNFDETSFFALYVFLIFILILIFINKDSM